MSTLTLICLGSTQKRGQKNNSLNNISSLIRGEELADEVEVYNGPGLGSVPWAKSRYPKHGRFGNAALKNVEATKGAEGIQNVFCEAMKFISENKPNTLNVLGHSRGGVTARLIADVAVTGRFPEVLQEWFDTKEEVNACQDCQVDQVNCLVFDPVNLSSIDVKIAIPPTIHWRNNHRYWEIMMKGGK